MKSSGAERISHIPAHANQDDVLLEAVTFGVDHVSSGNVTTRTPSLREPTPRPPTQQNRRRRRSGSAVSENGRPEGAAATHGDAAEGVVCPRNGEKPACSH